jgi:4-hydroxybenzoate polyprenyltransferase
MKKQSYLNVIYLSLLFVSLIILPGCEFIGDVFKAGVWVGIIIVIAIIAVIAFVIKMFSK